MWPPEPNTVVYNVFSNMHLQMSERPRPQFLFLSSLLLWLIGTLITAKDCQIKKFFVCLFYVLSLRTGRLSSGRIQWSFSTRLFLTGNVPTMWVQLECHCRGPVSPQITYCAYQCNQDQVTVRSKS